MTRVSDGVWAWIFFAFSTACFTAAIFINLGAAKALVFIGAAFAAAAFIKMVSSI